MTADQFITRAIEQGETKGLSALTATQHTIFLIAEAEVYCDMEGIDGLLTHYNQAVIVGLAQAYSEIGAQRIAEALTAIAQHAAPPPDSLLDAANTLITGRHGYDYTTLRAFVERAPEFVRPLDDRSRGQM